MSLPIQCSSVIKANKRTDTILYYFFLFLTQSLDKEIIIIKKIKLNVISSAL